jgi:hypothetical protein
MYSNKTLLVVHFAWSTRASVRVYALLSVDYRHPGDNTASISRDYERLLAEQRDEVSS